VEGALSVVGSGEDPLNDQEFLEALARPRESYRQIS
jgi:hypothetical protein